MKVEEFRELADSMLVDRPLNEKEEEILRVIKKYSFNSPYEPVTLDEISERDLEAIEVEPVTELIDLYLSADPRNYPRLGWFFRRLSQVGVPSGVDYSIAHLEELIPILGAVAHYLMRASGNYVGDIKRSAESILRSLDLPVIQRSEYIQMVLLNLFSGVPELDHANRLTARYSSMASSAVRREIVLAVAAAQQAHSRRSFRSSNCHLLWRWDG